MNSFENTMSCSISYVAFSIRLLPVLSIEVIPLDILKFIAIQAPEIDLQSSHIFTRNAYRVSTWIRPRDIKRRDAASATEIVLRNACSECVGLDCVPRSEECKLILGDDQVLEA